MNTTTVKAVKRDNKEELLWYCREEIKEFGNVTNDTLEECKSNGITLEEINKAIEHLGATINK